jgi:septal ring factor EnvC (AmiA/AmiB activator)
MSSPRRSIIRASAAPNRDCQHPRQLQKLRARLEHERTALGRWQTRLRRAFNTVEKHQKAIARIERQLARLEDSRCPA